MTYRSKKDAWIVLLVAVPGTILIATALYLLLALGINHPDTWPVLIAAIFYWTIIGLLAYPIHYEITPSRLLIRSGVLRFSIPLSKIVAVRPTHNPLSAPAWSLDRLRIDYRKNGRRRFALISPEDQARFLAELVQRDPGLELRGKEIVRTAD